MNRVIFVCETPQGIEEHIEYLKKIKLAVQPSLFCIEEDIFSIIDVFLYIEGIRYNFKSVGHML